MASLRAELLRRIFKKGVETFPEKELAKVFAGPKLHRIAPMSDVKELMKTGFLPEGKGITFDTPGLYYYEPKSELGFVPGKGYSIVEGVPRPGAKSLRREAPPSYIDVSPPPKKDVDFIKRPGEWIQLQAGNVLARTKDKGKWRYRIIGATGAAAGGLMSTNEAEAGPISSAFKALTKTGAKKVLSKPLQSRSQEMLLGTPFQGRTITGVSKGASNWRHIHLDDDTVVPVTKDVLADMTRAQGTAKYVGRFEAQETQTSQLTQALKSLEYHMSRSRMWSTRDMLRNYWKNYRNQLREAGTQVPDLSLVTYKGKNLMMPTEYADMLVKEKAIGLKIVERLR